MSYGQKLLQAGYIGDSIEEFSRAIKGDTRSWDGSYRNLRI